MNTFLIQLCLSWIIFLLAYVYFAQFPLLVIGELAQLYTAKGKAIILGIFTYLALSIMSLFIKKTKVLYEKHMLYTAIDVLSIVTLVGFVSYQVFSIPISIK
ncbi:hypothetical protein [Agarilytica rhodophyticola]|uniref:hypothetical protein n=1 Tax=Agarilytica rhodophyticola TaxID=1737490 RepID=UPI000B3481D6|nr:hypothetical protein [Agarilytica rhodophyticola]